MLVRDMKKARMLEKKILQLRRKEKMIRKQVGKLVDERTKNMLKTRYRLNNWDSCLTLISLYRENWTYSFAECPECCQKIRKGDWIFSCKNEYGKTGFMLHFNCVESFCERLMSKKLKFLKGEKIEDWN